MKLVVVISLLLTLAVRFSLGEFLIDESDGQLSTVALVKKYGYRVRQYAVTTNDGYQLMVHRMQRKRGTDPQLLPVLIVHGLLGSSADWVLIGPENGLGYLLANAGYDVWLANTRGNRYSRRHLTLAPEEPEFWNFSWHEKGTHDLPAMIDFILNEPTTKARSVQQIYYIGYSEGGSVYYVLTSSLPQYNAKIRLAHTLAPAVLLNDMRSPLVLSLSENAASLLPVKAVQAMLGHFPSGAALKEVEHYNQIIVTGIFRPFMEENNENFSEPYNLSASTAPVYIYYGINDWVVHPRNVPRFAAQLPNVRERITVGGKKFNHIDFLIGKRVKSVLYDKILFNLRKDTQTMMAQDKKMKP
ncbi:lipase 1-like [Anopheles ziemanni]|uniref:lipase 1-like n=1 Tax=Anopheles coustani TaxID=139045 RepID=UPI00265AD6D5|nr:lipase 1-like [Anopheles coustani]XP_058168934.1 lipase 1-like [Anopheles ziemanni]